MMFRSLLVPLDGSSFGEHALPLAASIARRAGATLHLVHVHVPLITVLPGRVPSTDYNVDAQSREGEQAYLEGLRAQVGTDLSIRCTILDGPVASTLAAHAEGTQTDLVVMTTHGRGGLSRVWLGNVADSFIRQSGVPTLLVRPTEAPPDVRQSVQVQRVMIPLDGSALAEQVLEPALALGDLMQATYTLLHVVHSFGAKGHVIGLDMAQVEQEVIQQRTAEAQAYLNGIVNRLQAAGRQVQTHISTASQPAVGILDAARQDPTALLALATHGHGGVRRLLLGSVADKVVRGMEQPVLLYRPRQPAA